MQTQRINITLPNDLIKDLKRTVPDGKRSQFISEAVREKISKKKNLKKEWIKSLKGNCKLYKEEGKIWDVTIADGLDKW